jgi:branched-chain amino acid transport system permease protein
MSSRGSLEVATLVATYGPLFDLVCVYSILSFSQYVSLRAGVFSLGTPGFALLGAYCGGILIKETGVGALASAAAATSLGAGAGLALALPLARLQGGFQAIATIAFMQIMVSLALYAEPLTGGALGLNAIPKVATTPWLTGALVLTAALLTVVNRTGIGRAFDAIRQDPTVASSLGVSVPRFFRLNFGLSGAIAALGGCLLAFNTYSVSPGEFGFQLLVVVLASVILGGRSMVAGPIIGAFILLLLPEVARPLRDQRLLLQGALLIAMIIYMPQGIVDTIIHRWHLVRRVRAGRSSP